MQLFSIILGEKEILKGKKKNMKNLKVKKLIFFLVRVSVVCLHNAQND